jgi:molybdate transport system permease protein
VDGDRLHLRFASGELHPSLCSRPLFTFFLGRNPTGLGGQNNNPRTSELKRRNSYHAIGQAAATFITIRSEGIFLTFLSFETWQITFFSLSVGLASTLLILPFGIALAWLFARKEWPLKSIIETLVLLPLVMPPVSTGLILLKIFGRRSPLGQWLYERGIEIVFNWKGVLIAMSVMSFPLLVRSVRTSFAEVNPRLEQIASTLGASPLRIFFVITIPLAYKGIVAGALLAFSRALGEFGATILLAGNIPGQTQTLSLAIYNFVQLGKDSEAYTLLGITVALAFLFVWCSEWLLRTGKKT